MNANPLPAPEPAAAAPARLVPFEVAPDTFVIQDFQGGGAQPVVHLNSMVIRAAEPIVVDTGAPSNRRNFLDDVFSLVDPDDLRWVFLSHDDVDHYGNVEALLELCPRATLVTNWFTMTRMACDGFAVPPTRMRWLADGEPLDLGDRLVVATRPPLYDAPTSRGLFDTRTRVYWAADCFAAPVSTPTPNATDLSLEEWIAGFQMFQQWNSPWIDLVADDAWTRLVDEFAALGVQAIASCHGPAIRGADHVAGAIEQLRRLPGQPVAPQPGQQLLDQIVGAMSLDAVA